MNRPTDTTPRGANSNLAPCHASHGVATGHGDRTGAQHRPVDRRLYEGDPPRGSLSVVRAGGASHLCDVPPDTAAGAIVWILKQIRSGLYICMHPRGPQLNKVRVRNILHNPRCRCMLPLLCWVLPSLCFWGMDPGNAGGLPRGQRQHVRLSVQGFLKKKGNPGSGPLHVVQVRATHGSSPEEAWKEPVTLDDVQTTTRNSVKTVVFLFAVVH